MKTSTFIRWSGLFGILAGLSSAAATLLEANPSPALTWIYLVSNLSVLVALVGIYLFIRERAGVWGLLGFAIAEIGNLLFFFDALLVIGGSIYGLGLILLAVGALKAANLPPWVPILWIAAPLIGIPGFLLPDLADVLFVVGGMAFALGFIVAGYTLFNTPAPS